MLEPLAPLAQDELAGRFATLHSSHRDLVWPQFPAVMAYLAGVAVDLLKQKVPASIYAFIMNVEGLIDKVFPPCSASGAKSEGSLRSKNGTARRTTARPSSTKRSAHSQTHGPNSSVLASGNCTDKHCGHSGF